ncbi:MAG: N-acetylmuramoyl-L-alanine amidase, partial [Clostridia bacterium]|nr:N-acetylmuramoyl-L-alanine amidase [Clostridia bacterium]
MKNKKWLIVLITVCAIAVIVAIVVGVNLNKKSDEDLLIEQLAAELASQNLKGEDPEEDEDITRAVIKNNGNSKLVDITRISPNKNSPRNHEIDTITIGIIPEKRSIESLGELFSKTKSQASSNYGVDNDGRIGMYVEEKDRSWRNGSRANDNRAITIVVSSDFYAPYEVSDAAYKSLINLVTDICKRNGIKKLVWKDSKEDRLNRVDGANMTVRRDFANVADPGEYLYSRMGDIANKVNEKLGA